MNSIKTINKNQCLAACDASIRHWRENLELAKSGEDFSWLAEDCAFCAIFNSLINDSATGCALEDNDCPLVSIGECCNLSDSAYERVKKDDIPSIEKMVSVLERAKTFVEVVW